MARTAGAGPQTKSLSEPIPTKAALRTAIRAELKKMPAAERATASLKICSRLEEQAVWKNAHSILFYAPHAEEPDIWPLVQDTLAAGKEVFLPRYLPEQNHYEACRIKNLELDLRAGQFGIREPVETCAKMSLNRLDLILVPGIAFDMGGHRIGRGKGFYDRLLVLLQGPTCGVAFDQQIIPSIPFEAHDIRLSSILTPTRWLDGFGPRTVLK